MNTIQNSELLRQLDCPICKKKGLFQGSKSQSYKIYCQYCNTELTPELLQRAILTYVQVQGKARQAMPGFRRSTDSFIDERGKVYKRIVLLDSISFILFFAFLGYSFPLDSIPWIWFFVLLLVSRVADIQSTFFALSLGGVETNPASDPHEISKLISVLGSQVLKLAVASLLLGLISPWLRIGLLSVVSLIGFAACFSNIGQVFAGFAMYASSWGSNNGSNKLLYGAHVVSIILICGIVYELCSAYFG